MLKPEEVKISFFKIHRCGFYAHGANQASFSSVDDVLTQLQQWTDGEELSLTRIHDPNGREDENPVYLFGIKKHGPNWVFATWNEIPSHESGVPSVSMNAKVGETVVHMNDIEEDSIPGYATYYWAIPGRDVIATIRFPGGRSGQLAMSNYLNRFMSSYMSYTLVEQRGGEEVIVGYTDRNDGVAKKVRPMFKTFAFQKPNRSQFLIQNVANIRRVVRRGHVTTTNVVDRNFWQNAVRFLRSTRQTANVVKQRVYVELDYRPTLQELQEMIAAEENDLAATGWDDMGFIIEGDPTTHWLGKEHASGDFTFNIERINEEAVDLDSLLQALQDNQANILRLLE